MPLHPSRTRATHTDITCVDCTHTGAPSHAVVVAAPPITPRSSFVVRPLTPAQRFRAPPGRRLLIRTGWCGPQRATEAEEGSAAAAEAVEEAEAAAEKAPHRHRAAASPAAPAAPPPAAAASPASIRQSPPSPAAAAAAAATAAAAEEEAEEAEVAQLRLPQWVASPRRCRRRTMRPTTSRRPPAPPASVPVSPRRCVCGCCRPGFLPLRAGGALLWAAARRSATRARPRMRRMGRTPLPRRRGSHRRGGWRCPSAAAARTGLEWRISR